MGSGLDEAFEAIEQSILPSVSMMLDSLIDASAMARAGTDADDFAAELRALALQLDGLTRQVESVLPAAVQEKPAASAA